MDRGGVQVAAEGAAGLDRAARVRLDVRVDPRRPNPLRGAARGCSRELGREEPELRLAARGRARGEGADGGGEGRLVAVVPDAVAVLDATGTLHASARRLAGAARHAAVAPDREAVGLGLGVATGAVLLDAGDAVHLILRERRRRAHAPRLALVVRRGLPGGAARRGAASARQRGKQVRGRRGKGRHPRCEDGEGDAAEQQRELLPFRPPAPPRGLLFFACR
mmetsp:Transcript_45315/g.147258  ORF Transcript_45315/g.147258 Transcript_45315/m.147258 type:complete len:222 (+) Transcript_45315:576-1241(+)